MAFRLTTSTEYDMECLEELQWAVSKTIDGSVARRERVTGFLWAVFGFTGSVVALRQSAHPALVAFLFVVGLYFVQRLFRVYHSMARKSFLDMDKDVIHNDYVLEKSGITAKNAKGEAQYPYSNCFRLLETENRLYVILEDGQGIVLDKRNVSGGSAEDLKRLLESRCGKKAEYLSRRIFPSGTLPSFGGRPRRL